MPEWLGASVRTARNLGLAALVAALLSTWLIRPHNSAGHDAFYGVAVDPTVAIERAMPRLSDLGVHTVRLHMEIKDWGRPTANVGGEVYDNALQQAEPLKREGFLVILQVASSGGAMPSYSRAKAVFEWLLTRSGASSVGVFEVFGPVTDHASNADAFSTTLSLDEQAQRYVQGPLKAAWDVFHPARRKVLGGAFTPYQQLASYGSAGGATQAVTQAYVRAGYLDYVDYAGVHPSQQPPRKQADWVRAAQALLHKPVWVSEWSIDPQQYLQEADFARALTQTVTALRPLVAVLCYTPFYAPSGSARVVQEAFLSGYRAQQPAYDAYKSWPKG
jgi:hypothetical protein